MSTFFTTLMKLLNIKHRISAAKAPRSNGLAEALVKRLSEWYNRICENWAGVR